MINTLFAIFYVYTKIYTFELNENTLMFNLYYCAMSIQKYSNLSPEGTDIQSRVHLPVILVMSQYVLDVFDNVAPAAGPVLNITHIDSITIFNEN